MPVASDTTLSTLQQINIKVRRLTRSPSASQITDDQINNYVNTFILYDLPENLKLFSLHKTFSFYCNPYVDRYTTNTTDPTNQFYNFKNQYLSIAKQVTIAGFPAMLSESREQFYGIYPLTFSINSIAFGDGVTTLFQGYITSAQAGFGGGFVPIIRGEVLFSSVDIYNNGLAASDRPRPNTDFGDLIVPTSIYNSSPTVIGFINYITGEYSVDFPTPPQAYPQTPPPGLIPPYPGTPGVVYSQTIPFVPARPQALLYFDDTFILRPVPDIPYKITMECFVRPSVLLNTTDVPQLSQWWQYIAYGAAKKIFEDRMDTDSLQMIMPEFKNQERLVQRRTVVNAASERTATIFTEQVDISSGISGWGGNNV